MHRVPCLQRMSSSVMATTSLARRPYVAMQPSRNSAVHSEESKQPTHRCDLLLQARPAQTLAGLNNIRLKVTGLNRPQRDFLRIEMIQKAPTYISVVSNSRYGKPAYVAQVIRIFIGAHRRGGAYWYSSGFGGDHAVGY